VDILSVEIEEDVPQICETHTEMRVILPAPGVMGLQSRLPQNLNGESYAHRSPVGVVGEE